MPRVGYGLVSLYSSSQSSSSIIFGEQTGNFITGLSEAGRVCLYPNKSIWSSVTSTTASCRVVEWVSEQNPPATNTEPLVHTDFRKTVLVTGAAGSIGSEIVRQLLNFSPKEIILFDNNENSLFNIKKELESKKSKTNFHYLLKSLYNI